MIQPNFQHFFCFPPKSIATQITLITSQTVLITTQTELNIHSSKDNNGYQHHGSIIRKQLLHDARNPVPVPHTPIPHVSGLIM